MKPTNEVNSNPDNKSTSALGVLLGAAATVPN